MRAHLAANLISLRDQHRRYKNLPTVTARNRELAKAADVSLSQIQRITERELGVSIDIVEALARALDVRPQDMLTPYFLTTEDSTAPVPRELRRR